MGKPVVVAGASGAQGGQGRAVSGDNAEGVLNGKKPRVRACETPEFFERFGCPHRDGWAAVVFDANETV